MFLGPVLSPRVALPGPRGRADPGARDTSLDGGPASATGLSSGPHSEAGRTQGPDAGRTAVQAAGLGAELTDNRGAPGQHFCKPGGLPGGDGAALAVSRRIQTRLLLMTFS